ncbi:MAG: hypothetical protein GQ537_04890, partial [Gammaproteobacteria bacterium]|nr:hypothetical protein [Gammaproteobacteria bacterium]
LEGQSITIALTRGKVLLRRGDAAGSVQQLWPWRDDGNADVNLLLASAQLMLRKVEPAKSSLLRVEHPEALSEVRFQGWCETALSLRMYNMVGSVSRKREAAQGASYRTRHYFGVIAYRQGNPKQAEGYFRESLEHNAHSGVTLAYLGHALWKQRRVKEAVVYYRKYDNYWGQNATISKRIKLGDAL